MSNFDSDRPTDFSLPESQRGLSLVLHERFVTSGPARIELKECGKFHDADGNVLFKLAAKKMTTTGRIVVEDAEGAHVGYVRRSRTGKPGCPVKYVFGTKRNDKVGTIKAKRAKPIASECDAEIYLGSDFVGQTAGNWFNKSFKIDMAGIKVVNVLRLPDCADGGFYIDIAFAGIDLSFVVMVVLALGQIHDWTDSNHGGVCSNILSRCSSDFNKSLNTSGSSSFHSSVGSSARSDSSSSDEEFFHGK